MEINNNQQVNRKNKYSKSASRNRGGALNMKSKVAKAWSGARVLEELINN